MIKKIAVLLPLLLCASGCSSPPDTAVPLQGSDADSAGSGATPEADTPANHSASLDEKALSLAVCNCKVNDPGGNPFHSEVWLSDYPEGAWRDTLKKWVNNPERLNVKNLNLNNMESIPEELKIFENVECLEFRSGPMISNGDGFHLFPKLKALMLEDGRFDIRGNEPWLKNIEWLYANKTYFRGWHSFTQMPNLTHISISFSSFDCRFPSGLDSIPCLTQFTFGACFETTPPVDLTTIDLGRMPCLQSGHFNSWHKGFTGLPRGLDKVPQAELIVHYEGMPSADKEKLKARRSGK